MGLVTLAYVSCVTSIVAAPIKLQYFKNYENRDVYTRNYLNGHENGEHMMASSVVKEVGTKVAQFMGYKTFNLNRYKCNKWNTFKARHFWDSTTGFGKSLDKVCFIFCLWKVL